MRDHPLLGGAFAGHTAAASSAQRTNDLVRMRVRHIDNPTALRLIDRVLELVDEDGKLVGTWQGDLQRALREAMGCPVAGDHTSTLQRTGVRSPPSGDPETESAE